MSILESKLLRQLGQANKRFDMVEPGDRILVAVSGGKDSWSLLSLLRAYGRLVPFDFTLVAVTIDQGQPGFDGNALEQYYAQQAYDYRIEYRDTYSVVVENTPDGKAYCALCSRMRRGILYGIAAQLQANKIALGHHRDDFIETLLLNQFYSGRIRSMAPTLAGQDNDAAIIRPLVLTAETDLIAYAQEKAFPIIPCNLCGSQEHLKRKEMKALLADLEVTNPRVRGNLLAALGNVELSHLLTRQEGSEASSQAPDASLIQITSP